MVHASHILLDRKSKSVIKVWTMLNAGPQVLSIDAQRLELADVLASNKVGMVSPVESKGEKDAENENQGFLWKKMLRARTTKSGSLLLVSFLAQSINITD